MSSSLALFQVDHDNVVVRGVPALERTLQTGDLTPLRDLLKSFSFDESAELTAYLTELVDKLRENGAPAFLIESQERRLASVRAPAPGDIDQAPLAELRTLLGGWCREARSVDLDKAWDLVHWYCDPGRRGRALGDWWMCRLRAPSVFDYALYGCEPYPSAADGEPVIHTGGSPDDSRYNPPEVVAQIAIAVATVPIGSWTLLDQEIDTIAEEKRPYLACCDGRLEIARDAFDLLAECYRSAAARGFGVSVEPY
jgi:hypothetical protein